jgi:hypothetical protein
MSRKDELQKIIRDARDELNAIQEAEDLEANRKLLGKCFVYINSYGPNSSWPLYIEIRGLDGSEVKCFEFQTDSAGKVTIRTPAQYPSILQGAIPITKRQFDAAWRKTLKRINSLATVD